MSTENQTPEPVAQDQSITIAKLAEALSKAQAVMEPALKDSTNPHFKSRYADLASVWTACREPLTKHGLSVVQRVSSTNGMVVITTQLLHSSGEWLKDRLTLPVQQQSPQGYGSAITYGRRYALAAMVGVAAEEDDDGNAASLSRPPQYGASSRTAELTASLKAQQGQGTRPADAPKKMAIKDEPPEPAKDNYGMRIAELCKKANMSMKSVLKGVGIDKGMTELNADDFSRVRDAIEASGAGS